jgi:hypothetical protein
VKGASQIVVRGFLPLIRHDVTAPTGFQCKSDASLSGPRLRLFLKRKNFTWIFLQKNPLEERSQTTMTSYVFGCRMLGTYYPQKHHLDHQTLIH